MDHPLESTLPDRRVTRVELEGQTVELPAAPATVGSAMQEMPAEILPQTDAVQLVHRGPLGDAAALMTKVSDAAKAAGRAPASPPAVLVLEKPAKKGDPILMVVYVAVKQKSVEVEVSI